MQAEIFKEQSLSLNEIRSFHQNGFLGPYTLFDHHESVDICSHIDSLLFGEHKLDNEHKNFHNRHLEDEILLNLSLRSNLSDKATRLLGDDALLWRTHFWNKKPGSTELPWHQDYNYWPIEPSIVVSAWVAFDDIDQENACVQLIPKSHRKILPHIDCGGKDNFGFIKKADPDTFEAKDIINMELKAGQYFLFNERMLHHSNPNKSNRRRLGMAIRIISGITEVMDYDSENHVLYPYNKPNTMGLNKLAL